MAAQQSWKWVWRDSTFCEQRGSWEVPGEGKWQEYKHWFLSNWRFFWDTDELLFHQYSLELQNFMNKFRFTSRNK
jgi:hypothetical protein